MEKITLPGLIDIHVHLRDPGQTHKEDFYTGTAAALAGGFTTVLDMPNKLEPIINSERLDEERTIAQSKAVSEIGFYFGSLGDNLSEFAHVQDRVYGLKLYLNLTTGGFIINEPIMKKIYQAWKQVSTKPILLHSEEDTVSMVTQVIKETGQRSHFCHVSSAHELKQIIQAKEAGLPITCGVCPHHLFLTQDDVGRLGPYAMMKPTLKTREDVEFLWQNLKYIDVFESDHAPHTRAEKDSDTPPFGVPGLETTLPLLLMATNERNMTIQDIILRCYQNPKKIFALTSSSNTKIVVRMEQYLISDQNLFTKCGWTPYAGMHALGKVEQVVLRDKKVFENGKVLSDKGSGYVI